MLGSISFDEIFIIHSAGVLKGRFKKKKSVIWNHVIERLESGDSVENV